MADEWVYGLRSVGALLERDALGVRELWVQSTRLDEPIQRIASAADLNGIKLHRVQRKTLDRLAKAVSHQGVVARYRSRHSAPATDLKALLAGLSQMPLMLVLDGVQDPHNLGAVLRSADAAGAHAVIVPRSRSVHLTPAVRKVACGAAETVPLVVVANLARSLESLQDLGVHVVGAASGAPCPLYQADLAQPVALVLGGEQGGLRRLTREKCDLLVNIPMTGTVQSLNVSVAAGVLLFEANRQRSRA